LVNRLFGTNIPKAARALKTGKGNIGDPE